VGGKHRRLSGSDLDILRYRQVNWLSLECVAKLEAHIVACSELGVAKSPSGISSTRNIVELEIHTTVAIPVVVGCDIPLFNAA
jgi:hypothetical protein